MGKIYLIPFVLLILLSCDNKTHTKQNNASKLIQKTEVKDLKYFEIIISDFSEGSFFISVVVMDSKGNGSTIVIENSVFYNMLRYDNSKLDEKSYKNMMLDSILKMKSIKVSDSLYSNLNRFRVNTNLILIDKDNISKYFNANKVLINVSYEKQKRIILELFNRKILVYCDDETGFIVMHKYIE